MTNLIISTIKCSLLNLSIKSSLIFLSFLLSGYSQADVFENEYDFVLPSNKVSMGVGLDVRTGSFSYSNTDMSIGTNGSTLSLTRSYSSNHLGNGVESFGLGTTHNYNIYLAKHSPTYHFGCGAKLCVNNRQFRSVVIGGTSFNFSGQVIPGTTELDENGPFHFRGGSEKVVDLSLTTVQHLGRAHKVWQFFNHTDGYSLYFDETDWGGDCAGGQSITNGRGHSKFTGYQNCTPVSHQQLPNGDFISFKNEKVGGSSRLKEVVNTRGYGLKFSYAANTNLLSRVDGIRVGCTTSSTVNCNQGTLPYVVYDYNGTKLDSVTDAEGHVWYYNYNSYSQMTAARHSSAPAVKVFENVYTQNLSHDQKSFWAPVTKQYDDRRNIWKFDYTYEGGDLDEGGVWMQHTDTRSTNPLGGITHFKYGIYIYESNHADKPVYTLMPISITDEAGNKTVYEHRQYGGRNPIKIIFPSGRTFTSDEGSTVLKQYQLKYKASISSTLKDQARSEFFVDCASNPLSWGICKRRVKQYQNAKGEVTDFRYDDDHGGILATLLPPDLNGSRSLIKYDYSTFYPTSGVSPQLGWLTAGPIYRLTRKERCLAAATSLTDTCPTDKQIVSSLTYTPSTSASRTPHELSYVTRDPSGLDITTAFVYDQVGNTIEIDGPRAIDDSITFRFDNNRRETVRINPRPDVLSAYPASHTYYNGKGQTIRTVDGSYNSRTGNFTALRSSCKFYDNGGRVESVIGLGGVTSSSECPSSTDDLVSFTEYTYDTVGRSELTTQNLGIGQGENRITKKTYTARGQVHKIIRAFGTVIQQDYQTYTYTTNGDVETVTDAKSNVTSYTYDGHDRLDKTTFSDLTYEQNTYDLNNNVINKRTRDNKNIVYGFDPRDQMTSQIVPSAVTGDATTFSYSFDLAGQLATDSFDGIEQVYTFDKAGRLKQKTHHNGSMPVSYQYNDAGNVTLLTYPDGWQADFDYDNLGRVTHAFEGTNSQNEHPSRELANLDYDILSRVSTINYANGTSTTLESSDRNEITDLDISFSNNAVIYHDYSFNKVGDLSTFDVSDSELFWVSDNAANTTESYSSNNLNQYTSFKNQTLSYDDNGNLTNRGNGWTYAYNAANGLSRAYLNNVQQAHYIHYADGNRRYQNVNGAVERYFYTGDQEIYQTGNSHSDKQKRYLRLPGSVDQVLLMLDYSQSSTVPKEVWAHHNRQGSLVVTSDNSGVILDKFAYSAFGESQSTAVNSNGFPFRYTGQKYDEVTGLYYYKARYYDPELGRFLQTDPIGYQVDMNLYTYASNSPYTYVDPDGRAPDSVISRRTRPLLRIVGNASGSKSVIRAAALVKLDGALLKAAYTFDSKAFSAALKEHKGTVGAYSHKTASGKTYDGKGGPERALVSAKQHNTKKDPIVESTYQATGDKGSTRANRDALKLEAHNLNNNGGAKSENTLNKIDSPGTKKINEDKILL